VALVFSTLLWADLSNQYVWAVLLVTLAFGLLGFMDDYLKVTKRTSAGISARMKLLVQLVVASSAVFFLMRLQAPPLTGAVAIPFVKGALIQLGWGFLLFGALVIVGVVVSEMLISSAGIGYLISRYRTILDSPHVFAGVLLVLAMAVAFNAAIKWIERKAAIWQTGTRAGQNAAEDLRSVAIQPAT